MGEGAVVPERAPSVRAEVLLESERTRVTRLFVPRRTVIRKEPLGPDAHRRRPSNVVISSDSTPCLVGFASATSLAEIRPEFTHHTKIVGTLPYLAPEQTGRTGRSMDQRADLYGLGATLYELATGEPPFGSQDSLRLRHDVVARMPTSPCQVNPAVPEPLSAIIMHLLEKEPDDRYQSADGVSHDLARLAERGASTRAAARVGERDFPLRLLAPSRLAGRDNEVVAVSDAFEDALTGRCRGVEIGGAPGDGENGVG